MTPTQAGLRARCAVLLLLGAVAGCKSAAGTTAIDIIVEADASLVLDRVAVELNAPGKADLTQEFLAQPVVRWSVVPADIRSNLVVALEARGVRGGTTVVSYRAFATVTIGQRVSVPLRLSAACAIGVGPMCPGDQTCSEGACITPKVFGVGGADGGRDAAGDVAADVRADSAADAAGDRGAAVDAGDDAPSADAAGSDARGSDAPGIDGSADGGMADAGREAPPPLLAIGQPCAGDAQCDSHACSRDGVCCASACTLACQACSMAATGVPTGTCAPTTASGHQVCGGACVDVSGNDAMNCGACGHSCQGGACQAGVCRPRIVGTVPAVAALSAVLADGFIYLVAIPSNSMPRPRVYEIDAAGAGAPRTITDPSLAVTTVAVVDGNLFWLEWVEVNRTYRLQTCPVINCSTGLRTVVTRTPAGAGVEYTQLLGPFGDAGAHEVVWYESEMSHAILRAAVTASSARVANNVGLPATATIVPPVYGPPAALYWAASEGGGRHGLWSVTTTAPGAPAELARDVPGGGGSAPLASRTSVIWTSDDGVTYRAPLPNGVVSGGPPVFWNSTAAGLIDDQAFFGLLGGMPTDVISRCALSACTPAVLARGQGIGSVMVQDATAIYWVAIGTDGQTPPSLVGNVWKLAK